MFQKFGGNFPLLYQLLSGMGIFDLGFTRSNFSRYGIRHQSSFLRKVLRLVLDENTA